MIYVEKIDRINKLKSHECYLVHPSSGLTRRGGIDFRKNIRKNTMSEAPIVNTQESSIDTEDNVAKGRFVLSFDVTLFSAPRWVPIVAKCTALACSLSWGFGSIWLFIRGLAAIRCIFAAVFTL